MDLKKLSCFQGKLRQTTVIRVDRTQIWYRNKIRHRDGNKPAVIWSDNTQYWYRYGKLHRDDNKPAVIWLAGTKRWYRNGQQYTP